MIPSPTPSLPTSTSLIPRKPTWRPAARPKSARPLSLGKWAEQKTGADQTTLLKQALSNCLDVVYGTILRDHNENLDPFWSKEAGIKAFDLARELQAWSQAVNLYLRLKSIWPQLPPSLEKRALKARENLQREKASR